MPKKSVRAEVNSFVKGIITEASILNYPADASLDEANFVLNKDGSRDRRLGMDFESGFVGRIAAGSLIGIDDIAVNTFNWDNAGGNADNRFLVIQIGARLIFFNAEVENISANGYLGEIVPVIPVSFTKRWGLASVNGNLIVTTGSENIISVSYDGANFNQETFRIKTRDLFGIAVTIGGKDLYEARYVNFRPSTITDAHAYNLRNQSWQLPRRYSISNVQEDPINSFRTEKGVYPSNSDVVWRGMHFTATTPPTEEFYPRLIDESKDSKLEAAKGAFIIDALRRGTSRLTEYQANQAENPVLNNTVNNLPLDYTTGGASIVEGFAGRAWYAGFNGEVVDGDANSPNLSDMVFFSQLVKNKRDASKCYQEGDPASREGADIVDTDGGFIKISGAKKIITLKALDDALAVIADNGVWLIRGGSDDGFTATNYRVIRINEYGCISRGSVVVTGSNLFYWAEDGIYVLAKNQFGEYESNNITDATIKKLYESIDVDDKTSVKGLYDPFERKIRWLYSTGSVFSSNNIVSELILDLTLNAFSQYKISNLPSNEAQVVSLFSTKAFITSSYENEVVVGSDFVRVNPDQVIVSQNVRDAGTKSIKYLAFYVNGSQVYYTFSTYSNPNFLDWEMHDGVGVDAPAYIITGTITGGDTSIHKQVPYLVMHFRRTEDGFELSSGDIVPTSPSSCLVRSMWDFANSQNSNKWSPQFQAYRYKQFYMPVDVFDDYDTGFEVITTRNKIRGRGRAFSFRMDTSPGNDCRILGWSLSINGNQYV